MHCAPAADTRISSLNALVPPICLLEELPCEEHHESTVVKSRIEIQKVLDRHDDRMIVVVGPCSIHDVKAAKEYAHQLKSLLTQHQEDLLIVMRVYFEKPRTTVGWKGLINDPTLDGTFQINHGLKVARGLLLDCAALGIPTAVEFLDTISPQYIADLVSWGAIGARTTESQVHRELASGLSMPVGFKNATSGDVQVAADAVQAAKARHSCLGLAPQGHGAIVHTAGNPYGHLILRGGKSGTNYDDSSIANAAAVLRQSGCKPNVIVDCSHGNSEKKHQNQPLVAAAVAQQVAQGNLDIVGVMLESNIHAGKQQLSPGETLVEDLQYGVSVTDACIDLQTTATTLGVLAKATRERRLRRGGTADGDSRTGSPG